MGRMDQKDDDPAKQPFMFHYRCFLLRFRLKPALLVVVSWGALRTVEDHWGFPGSFGVKTGLVLGTMGTIEDF